MFRHLWIGWLQRAGWNPWLIALLVSGGLAVFRLAAESAVTTGQLIYFAGDFVYLAAYLWFLLMFGAMAERDAAREVLWPDSGSAGESPAGHPPLSRRGRIWENSVALGAGLLFGALGWWAEEHDPQALLERTFAERCGFLLRWLLNGALAVHLVAVVLRHIRFLDRRLRAMGSIDLLRTDDLVIVSNPLVYWLAFGALQLATWIFALMVTDMPQRYALAAVWATIATVGIASAYASIPVVRVAGMIRRAREEERERVLAGLRGETIAAPGLAIAPAGTGHGNAELIAWLQYLDGIWNWPIRRNLIRILFYLLIPPMAWVLAALVELQVDASPGG